MKKALEMARFIKFITLTYYPTVQFMSGLRASSIDATPTLLEKLNL